MTPCQVGWGVFVPKTKITPSPQADQPQSWSARYGQAILRDGIAAIPTAIFRYQAALGLTAQEVWFTAAVLAHKWDADLPSPSLKQMAGQTGVSVIQLQRFRARLCERGLLHVREQRAAHGGQRPNLYDFGSLFQELERLLGAEPPTDNGIAGGARMEEEAADNADLPQEPADNSFVARYGRVIARAGIAAIPQGLFTHQAALGLSPQQVWFTCYILAHRWSSALPHPSLTRMAERTGYSTRHMHEIKDELIAGGYLRLVRRFGSGGGMDANGYDFSGLLNAITAQLSPADPASPPPSVPISPGVTRLPRQVKRQAVDTDLPAMEEAAVNQRGLQQPHRGGLQQAHRGGLQQPHKGGLQQAHRGELQQPQGGAAQRSSGRATRGAQAGTSVSAYKKESDQEEPDQEDDSNPPGTQGHNLGTNSQDLRARGGERSTTPDHKPPEQLTGVQTNLLPDETIADLAGTQYVAAVMSDFSREFGDASHESANITQALRLWQGSGLAAHVFVTQLLYEARTRTRRAQGGQGGGQIENKMAYFFTVLSRLVAELQQSVTRHSG